MEENKNLETQAAAEQAVAETPAATEQLGEAALPKKKKGPMIAVIAAIVVVVIAAAAFFSFGDAHKQILKAAANTFSLEGTQLGKLADSAIMTQAKSSTATFEMSLGDDLGMKMVGKSDMDAKLADIDATVNYMGINVDFKMFMDAEKLDIQIPLISDKTLSYNYVEEKTGYLETMLASAEMTYADLDAILQKSFTDPTAENAKLAAKCTEITERNIKALEFAKVDPKDCTIDGATVNCKGFETTLTSEFVKAWIEEYKAAIEEYYAFYGANSAVLQAQSAQYTAYFDSLVEMVEESGDMKLTFYIGNKRFGSIVAEVVNDGSTVEVLFEGGDTPLQNGRILLTGVDGQNSEIAWKSEKEGDVSKFTVLADNAEVFTIQYDETSCKYEGSVAGEVTFSGVYKLEDESMDLSLDSLEGFPELEGFTFNMTATFECDEIKPLEVAEVFDLGNATEEDWNGFKEEVFGKLFGNPDALGALM